MTQEKMIVLEKVNKFFGKLHVLNDIDLEVDKGDITAVIGPSGSGKSTLLRCINHLEKIESGRIVIEGTEVARTDKNGKSHRAPEKDLRESYKKIGMVFQHFHLFPHLTVLENVIEAPMTVNHETHKEAETYALELLEKVGLSDKKDAFPSRLSGGQKQRVAIARALGMKPDIMLFDEPTSALDPELVGEVLGVIQKLAGEKMTMLIVTHEMNFARESAGRILFMDQGKIIEDATPEKMFKNPDHPRIKTFLDKMLRG